MITKYCPIIRCLFLVLLLVHQPPALENDQEFRSARANRWFKRSYIAEVQLCREVWDLGADPRIRLKVTLVSDTFGSTSGIRWSAQWLATRMQRPGYSSPYWNHGVAWSPMIEFQLTILNSSHTTSDVLTVRIQLLRARPQDQWLSEHSKQGILIRRSVALSSTNHRILQNWESPEAVPLLVCYDTGLTRWCLRFLSRIGIVHRRRLTMSRLVRFTSLIWSAGYQQTNNPAVLHRRQTQANEFRKCRTSSRPRAAPSVDEECGETLQ